MSFYGTGVRWIGTHGPEGGNAEVLIDGEPVSRVSQFRKDESVLNTSFEALNLEQKVHTIAIRVESPGGRDNAHGIVDVDALDVFP